MKKSGFIGLFFALVLLLSLSIIPAAVSGDAASANEVDLQAVGTAQDQTDANLEWISLDADAVPSDDAGTAKAVTGEGNQVLIIVHDDAADLDDTDDDDTVTVDVETSAGGADLQVTLTETAAGHFEGTFTVSTVTSTTAATIRGRHEGTLTLVYRPAGGGILQDLEIRVDEEGPDVDDINPDDEEFVDDEDVRFQADVTDREANLADDSADPSDVAARHAVVILIQQDDGSGALDTEDDNVVDGDGELDVPDFTVDVPEQRLTNIEDNGADIGMRINLLFDVNANGLFFWQVQSIDVAGNESFSAITEFTVDDQDPVMTDSGSETGHTFDADDDAEEDSRKGIRVQFNNDISGDAEQLDQDTIEESDFLVDSENPADVIVDEDKGRVYLILANDLAPDDEPRVDLIGTIRDKSGNSANLSTISSVDDGIAPELTVSVTGVAHSRPASNGDVTITLESDEVLVGEPSVEIFRVFRDCSVVVTTGTCTDETNDGNIENVASNAGADTGVGTLTGTDLTEETTNSEWTVDVDVSDLAGGEGLYVVRVFAAEDENGNIGDLGPEASDDVSTSSDVVFEVDLLLNDGEDDAEDVFTLSPSITTTETDVTGPVIRIEFGSEGAEYSATDDPDAGANDDTAGLAALDVDDHGTIEIISAEFGEEGGTATDVTDDILRRENNIFVYLPKGLTVGTTYELTVQAKDQVGNVSTTVSGETDEDDATSFTFEFDVVEPVEYDLDLLSGWNFVSFPSNPDSDLGTAGNQNSVDDIFGDVDEVSIVVGYDPVADPEQPWLFAERVDGTFEGNLTTIDNRHAYWINADIPVTVTASMPRAAVGVTVQGLQPPSITVVAGWNAVPVSDPDLDDQGDEVASDADDYFSTVDWLFAFTYDTETGRFDLLTPTSASAVNSGDGIWLWADAAGILVPVPD